MNEAKLIDTNIEGLSVKFAQDGVWLNFSTNGGYASVNLLHVAEARGAIVSNVLKFWCSEQISKHISLPAITGLTRREIEAISNAIHALENKPYPDTLACLKAIHDRVKQ
jgi:hypothetical protein